MNLFMKLIKSRTIQGIAISLAGFVIDNAKHLLSPEQLGQYNALITAVTSALQPGGLAYAVYGRVKARGPITPEPATPGDKRDSFDGTGADH